MRRPLTGWAVLLLVVVVFFLRDDSEPRQKIGRRNGALALGGCHCKNTQQPNKIRPRRMMRLVQGGVTGEARGGDEMG